MKTCSTKSQVAVLLEQLLPGLAVHLCQDKGVIPGLQLHLLGAVRVLSVVFRIGRFIILAAGVVQIHMEEINQLEVEVMIRHLMLHLYTMLNCYKDPMINSRTDLEINQLTL